MSLVGHRIGRYRIGEQVGSGGMSVVYKGLDTALQREVAVKVLHPHLAGKEESRRRLAREAQAVAKLRHPNILEVFDFAAGDSENAYIVTEFIRGQTLREFAEKRAFDPPEIAAMAIHEIAAALAHAHEAGIIHRDLKPENVMVRDDGFIKLMDFGIAKILDREDRMTMTGALVGSPAHMAPEIIEGAEIGPEADVFSLGTMLYYFATGNLPFVGPNATATLKKILDGTYEDPRKLAPAVCDRLGEIIATCLARKAPLRYRDARQLQHAVGEYLAELGISHPGEELGWFFLDPPAYRAQLTSRLVEDRLRRAETHLAEHQLAKALGCLNHVLALDANNARAAGLLERMNRNKRRRHLMRRAAVAAGCVAGLSALAAAGLRWHNRSGQPMDTSVLAEARPSSEPTSSRPPAAQPEAPPEDPAKGMTATILNPPIAPRRVSSKPPETAKPSGTAAKTAVATAKLTLLFRPFAYAQIDGGERQAENGQHEFQLAPGAHRLVYGCPFCEEQITTVQLGPSGNTVRFLVQPKPATLRFRCEPADAQVTLGGETRAAAETSGKPFQVRFPKGETEPQQVSYEISKPGFKPIRQTVSLPPGDTKTIEGRLEPE